MPTKTTFRRAAAKLIGPYRDGTATAGSTTAQLEDATWPMKTSRQVDDLYVDQFVYLPTALVATDYVRIVDTYTPAAGVIIPDLPWSASPDMLPYEIHGILEPHTEMTDVLNDVLRILVFAPDEISFTPTAGVHRHSLATVAPWLADRYWVRQAGWLDDHDDREDIDPYETRPLRGMIDQDGGAYYLYSPMLFRGTETVYLRVHKPAYYLCRPTGGVFGDQSGLALDTDECPVDENWVAAGVRLMAWDRLGNTLSAGNAALAKQERTESAQAFSFWTNRLFKPYELTFQPIEAWGPQQSGVPN